MKANRNQEETFTAPNRGTAPTRAQQLPLTIKAGRKQALGSSTPGNRFLRCSGTPVGPRNSGCCALPQQRKARICICPPILTSQLPLPTAVETEPDRSGLRGNTQLHCKIDSGTYNIDPGTYVGSRFQHTLKAILQMHPAAASGVAPKDSGGPQGLGFQRSWLGV